MMSKLNTLAMASALGGAMALNACAGTGKNSAVEYKNGVLTLAADPINAGASASRTATRNQVLALLGTGFEGRNANDSYVLCADMSSVYATPDVTEQDLDRISSRFELMLLDQARYLLVAEKCARFIDVSANPGCQGCVNYSTAQLSLSEGEVKGLSKAKSSHAGNYVCIWTTAPTEIECKK
jgi:hypothetical protein